MERISGMKATINRLVGLAGYEVRRVDRSSTMRAAVRRLGDSDVISTVIDVGASDGRWSQMAIESFPQATFLLFEAQAPIYEAALSELAQIHENVHYVLAAAGNSEGTIHFDTTNPFGGAASERAFAAGDQQLAMTTVDREIERLALDGPFLLKLDTHGFEREVLAGAARTLASTSALVIEAYNFELRDGTMRFHELCALLDSLGFRPSDLVDTLRRPSDGVLWQFDLVFKPHDGPEFASNSYD